MPPADLPPDEPAPAVDGLQLEVTVLRKTVERLDAELAGLRRAMASRAVIDQAKGAVRVVTGASADEAFALLAARSQHANRKLTDVAADVLAAADAPDRTAAVFGFLALPGRRRLHVVRAGPTGSTGPDSWRTRRRWDSAATTITDQDQLLALVDLGERLARAAGRSEVTEVLLHLGADALGAFGAGVAMLGGTGSAGVQTAGVQLGDGLPGTLPLDATHPVTEVLRSGRHLVLSRADLALRFPDHPRPERLRGLVVLSLCADTPRPAAWSLYLDRSVPSDQGTIAFLDRAARLGSGGLARATRPH